MNPRSSLAFRITIGALILVLIAGAAQAQVAAPYTGDIGTTFGSVTDTCAFEFGLFDATAGGSQIGPVIERELGVRGGRYETELDFGPEATDGGSRYLEVAVGCPAGTADLATLTRQAFVPGATVRSARAGRVTPASEDLDAPPKAAIGTGFTYQGELKQSGSPVTGLGDFQFSLWDALSGGVQIGTTVPAGAVGVEDGRFTASLDFGAAAFDGDARWLEIAVDYPSGTGSFTTLSPRQPLSAAPYALQTRGIFVDDNGDVGIGTTNPQAPLQVWSEGASTLRVRNASASGGTAILAEATSEVGYAYGLNAYATSPNGASIYAYNEADSGNAYTFFGENNSPDGIAIRGNAGGANAYAGYFSGFRNYFEGKVGIGTLNPSAKLHVSGGGDTLRLENNGGGDLIVARDNAAGQDHFWVDGSGLTHVRDLEVIGNAVISGDLTYSPERTFSLNIPAFALHESAAYNDDEWVTGQEYGYISSGSGGYIVSLAAPVHLPNNATVTELYAYFYDASAGGDVYVVAQIRRRAHFELDTETIADLRHGTAGANTEILSTSRSMSGPATIDNSGFQYLISVSWDPDVLGDDLRFYGIRIEYTIATLNP